MQSRKTEPQILTERLDTEAQFRVPNLASMLSMPNPFSFFALLGYCPKQATAAKYHERMEHERKAREDAAKSIVMGLGDGLDSFDSDVLASIADGIETVLKAPVSSEVE